MDHNESLTTSNKMSQTHSQTYIPTILQQDEEKDLKVGDVTTSTLLQSSITYTNQNLYSTYAENFDLSLLPQDCDTLSLNSPNTLYQFKNITPTAPEIKIEQTWPICESNFYESMRTPYQAPQLLSLPTNYAQAYPSPESSPAQSEHCFPQNRFNGAYESLSSSHTSLYVSSPCPSIDTQSIKQELHILPPSPPESSCEVPSPHSEVKSEPFDTDVDSIVSDLNTLLTQQQQERKQNVLREYVGDNSFQKKHNLKPLALESFIGDLESVRGDIESVISLALQHAKCEADETCRQLQISHNPSLWTTTQVHAWLQSTIAQFKLPSIENLAEKFQEDGAALIQLSQEEFDRRAPEIGSTLHAQLEIWKLACSDSYLDNCSVTGDSEPTQIQSTVNDNLPSQQQQQKQQQQNQNLWQESVECLPSINLNMEEETEDEEEILPSTSAGDIPMEIGSINAENKRPPSNGRTGGSHIHLWQFLKELLAASHVNGTSIRWIDRSKGIFKIEDSVRVAKLWGRRKNRPAMNYDKLSRSIRQYYKKGIMKKTERSQRLVYQFCHPYHL